MSRAPLFTFLFILPLYYFILSMWGILSRATGDWSSPVLPYIISKTLFIHILPASSYRFSLLLLLFLDSAAWMSMSLRHSHSPKLGVARHHLYDNTEHIICPCRDPFLFVGTSEAVMQCDIQRHRSHRRLPEFLSRSARRLRSLNKTWTRAHGDMHTRTSTITTTRGKMKTEKMGRGL